MINLLPPDLKNSYRYALKNVKLIRWAVALGFGFIGLFIISTASVIYMRQLAQSYEKPIADAGATLQKQNLHATQAQVKDITDSLKLSVQVLSKEVLFSKLLVRLANLTPDNTVLTDLSIIQATQMQVNLIDPSNKLFSHADIQSIVCDTTKAASGTAEAKYPCVVIIQALFSTNNPFLFTNDKGH
jgi:hypothetical protein